jgi:xanthine/uracil/vitamin C permease (AzgA family)
VQSYQIAAGSDKYSIPSRVIMYLLRYVIEAWALCAIVIFFRATLFALIPCIIAPGLGSSILFVLMYLVVGKLGLFNPLCESLRDYS